MTNGFFRCFGALLTVAFLTGCASATKTGPVVHLLQGKDKTAFYTYLKDIGIDKDPDQVFTLTNGVLRISGQNYGYMATRIANFSNYLLIAEFKWGEQTWAPRKDNARDSGILVHGGGQDQIWPKAIEAQMIEGGTGDILVSTAAI